MPRGRNLGSPSASTPGPWLVHATNRVVVQADGAFNAITVKDGKVSGDSLPTSICLLRDPSDDFSEDETLANGFLIAAAPDLLDAAIEALTLIHNSREVGKGPTNAEAMLNLAIRKARGES